MVIAPTGTVRPAVALNRERLASAGQRASGVGRYALLGGDALSHSESYADAAVKSNTCAGVRT
jgi:hypothetical protein